MSNKYISIRWNNNDNNKTLFFVKNFVYLGWQRTLFAARYRNKSATRKRKSQTHFSEKEPICKWNKLSTLNQHSTFSRSSESLHICDSCQLISSAKNQKILKKQNKNNKKKLANRVGEGAKRVGARNMAPTRLEEFPQSAGRPLLPSSGPRRYMGSRFLLQRP